MRSGTQTLVWAGTCELLIILGVPLYIVRKDEQSALEGVNSFLNQLFILDLSYFDSDSHFRFVMSFYVKRAPTLGSMCTFLRKI